MISSGPSWWKNAFVQKNLQLKGKHLPVAQLRLCASKKIKLLLVLKLSFILFYLLFINIRINKHTLQTSVYFKSPKNLLFNIYMNI